MEQIKKNLEQAKTTLDEFISSNNNLENIQKAGELMSRALKKNKKIISCGNGGSLNDAMHFAEELTGKFRKIRAPLPAVAISDPSHITCVANDFGYEYVFSRYIESLGNKGDVLLAISTSGNSPNIIKAVEAAKKKQMAVVGLTARDGGKLSGMCDLEIRAPYSEFADRAQEIHIKVIHCLIDFIEQKI